MSITPIADIQRRLPQAGRIRLGEQGNKGPKALTKFRFTSKSAELLEKVAELYGGQVKSWNEPKSDDRFELYSEASEINVVLAPDPYDAYNEMWKGSVCVRRCTGVTCVIQKPGPDGPEPTEVPCLCHERGAWECNGGGRTGPTQRLSVILPEVRGLGIWRLDTKSRYAAAEMPGVVDTLKMLSNTAMVRATLRIEQRHDVVETARGKQRHNFVVPVLDVAYSLDELASGVAKVSIGTGQQSPSPTIGVGPPGDEAIGALPPGADTDDEICDAEIVDDDEKHDVIDAWVEQLDPRDRNSILRQARQIAGELGEPLPASFQAITGPVLETIYRSLTT